MSRVIPLVLLAFAIGCDDGKAKVDKAIDQLDLDEAKQQLTKAKDAVAKGLDAVAECAWAARVADDAAKDAMKEPIKELKRICSFDAPLAKALKALQHAEQAKREQPEAPSLTECSSDDWAAMKRELDGGPHARDPRWTELKDRWAKVCPR